MKARANFYATGADGRPLFIAAGDEIPEGVVVSNPQIVGDEPAGEPEGGPAVEQPEAPPLGGPGSGRQAWADYAETLGVEIQDDDSREDIVDRVRDAGFTVD